MTENEKKTEKADETKDTTAEATPKDKADALAEKTLAAEKKKRQIRPETKTALGALGLIVLSMFYIRWVAFDSDQTSDETIGFLYLVGIAIGCVVSFIIAAIVIKGREVRWDLICILSLTWAILIFMIFPLSKYHNQNCLERDKKIAEIFQISKEKNKIMIILPDEYHQEHSYLQKVLSILLKVTDSNNIEDYIKFSWSEIAIPCRRGNKYWYEAELLLPKTATDIELRFNHAWEPYKITKEIFLPDPTDPNSL